VCLEASTKPPIPSLIHDFFMNMASTMAYPNFKNSLKIAFGPSSVKLSTSWRIGCKIKTFLLPIESWIFIIPQILFCLMVFHNVIFNLATWIGVWKVWFFSKKCTSSMDLNFLVRTSSNKNNSTPFSLANLKFKFEPFVFNLIWNWCDTI
jgi:hypothetical protein